MTHTAHFPNGFLWGSATASYQIEGGGHEDGRGRAIWDTFAATPGKVFQGHDGSVACDHFHRYREDVELMDDLGLQSYRFSVAWPRVMPDGVTLNPAGLDFYSRLVDSLLERDIVPWLTLYHWDLPQTLQDAGGWPARDTALRFVDYSAAVHDALGDRVSYWTTLNEPICSSFFGYGDGHHAPGHKNPAEALSAAHHLLLGHGLVTQELRRRDPALALGLTINFTDVIPAVPDSTADQDAARRADALFNRFFVEPVFRGAYPADAIRDLGDLWPAELVQDGDMEIISTPIDVLGVNYYAREAVTGPHPSRAAEAAAEARAAGRGLGRIGSEHVVTVGRPEVPHTAMGWEVCPEGLTRLLVRLHEEYADEAGVELFVTENGSAYEDPEPDDGTVADPDRTEYLRSHLLAVHDAIAEGVPVKGYFVWSLLDNFEWAHGYSKRFGIVHVDFDTLQRTPKASAQFYSSVARSNRIDLPVVSAAGAGG